MIFQWCSRCVNTWLVFARYSSHEEDKPVSSSLRHAAPVPANALKRPHGWNSSATAERRDGGATVEHAAMCMRPVCQIAVCYLCVRRHVEIHMCPYMLTSGYYRCMRPANEDIHSSNYTYLQIPTRVCIFIDG